MDKQAREYKKYLTSLVKGVEQYLEFLDKAMLQPESFERGKRIAHLTNQLNMCKDLAKRFGLGLSLKRKVRG